ncbi:MAG: hypothetical protein JJT76_01160 [Clostridiaceae bacterium]|nr:hypothetical protein [Clostridiaceae bacterium]
MKKFLTSILVIVMFCTFTTSTVGAFTPPGLAKKGGLPPGLQKKDELPPGIQKRFVDYEELLLVNREYETVIENINTSTRRIIVKQGTASMNLLVDNKANIELNGKEVELKDLKKGDKVHLKLDKDHTVTEIKAIGSEDRISVFEGTIRSIDKRRNEITIVNNNRSTVYKLETNTTIKVDGRVKGIDDLAINMVAKITIENDKVTSVEASTSGYTKIEGTIEELNYRNLEMVVKTGSRELLYQAKSNTPVYIDNTATRFSNLLEGMEVEVYILDSEIRFIRANSLEIETFTATVGSINYRNGEVVLKHDNKEVLYNITDSIIKINGTKTTIRSIKEDMKVEVKLQNKEILEIDIIDETNIYEGRLIEKDTSRNPSIIIRIDGTNKTFDVDSDVNLSRVSVGSTIKIYVEDGVVLRIS